METNTIRSSTRLLKESCAVVIAISLLVVLNSANAEIFGGIDFPGGVSSFADSVIQYNPLYSGGPAPTNAAYMNTVASLGAPDYPALGSYVSLGSGGLIELEFTDNVLTNSGNANMDLHIFEVGPDVEDTFVAIRPTPLTAALLGPGHDDNADGFYEIGKVFGATSSIDIDAFFPGFLPGALLFDAVQLIDDPAEGYSLPAPTVGADIDAVGAIQSQALPLIISIDIKPGSCPNPFNAKAKGTVPVAIVGTAAFDVTTVDPESITLNGVSPLRWATDDSTQPDGDNTDCFTCFDAGDPANFNCDLLDADGNPGTDGVLDSYCGDGFPDLVLQFDAQELAAAIGAQERDACVELTLTGQLLDATAISASDSVIIRTK